MQCELCGETLTTQRLTSAYSPHLPTVLVDGVEHATCPRHGDAGLVYPRPTELSALIVRALLDKPGRLAPGEVAFLRGALGFRGKELAAELGVTPSQVSRWESGAMPISALADRLLRVLMAVSRGWPLPSLSAINPKRAEPLVLRITLGVKGWRLTNPADAHAA